MPIRRRKPDFVPLGEIRPEQTGLGGRRSAELRLILAWRAVAGDVVARSARAIRVRRGVLEIEVTDRRWLETLKDLLPALAARLSREHAGLGVRRFRLRLAGEDGPSPESQTIPREPGDSGP